MGDERTPLYVAVEKRAHRVIEHLMAAGARPQSHAKQRKTPLALAYSLKDYEAVELMEGPGTRTRIEADLASATEHTIPQDHCQGLEALRASIGPITNEPRFDVNRFLEVFDRVNIEPGHVLDYYHDHLDEPLELPATSAGGSRVPRRRHDRLRNLLGLEDVDDARLRRRIRDPDAHPCVFSRPSDADRGHAAAMARDQYRHRSHLMEHLSFDRSPESLLQWVIFRTAVTQFHLCWHANYNDRQFILTPVGLERVLQTLPWSDPGSCRFGGTPWSSSTAARRCLNPSARGSATST